MYDMKFLCKIPYFKSFNITTVTDTLTGVINKTYIINYINQLIYEKRPFSLALLDIDNFKNVNDTYGHHIGDLALHEIGAALINYVGDNGVVGRFGGDEFLVVYFNNTDYDSQHHYISEMYKSEKAIRKNYNLEGLDLFISATTGSASYPKDAQNYYDLFHKVDQALYRGKMKGRNCFIIYVHEKHKDIDVFRNVRIPLYKMFVEINDILESDDSFDDKTFDVLAYTEDKLNVFSAFILEPNLNLICNNETINSFNDIPLSAFDGLLDAKGYCSIRKIEELDNVDERITNWALQYNIHSVLMTKIEYKENFYGYFFITENKVERIWQENDLALVKYISKILAFEIERERK